MAEPITKEEIAALGQSIDAWVAILEDHGRGGYFVGGWGGEQLRSLHSKLRTGTVSVAPAMVVTGHTKIYPLCGNCGHRHDHHRHHSVERCYDCDCPGYGPGDEVTG